MSTSSMQAQSMIDAMAEQAMTDGVFGQYDINKIRISPDNRKRFNEQALQELAESIKSVGVAQAILIRPVDPTPEAPEEFEIVAGERRFRASKIAGKATIPALCRNLSNLDAAKIRILENLQREDPHPMEEAEGYQLLMLQHGFSADQLAYEVNKSKAYVYARLKLCALAPDARAPFLNNEISASIALLIARIPVPTLQLQALKEVLTPSWPSQEPMSVRQATRHIQDRYTLDLGRAIFKLSDAKLLVAAGACTKCPKRTGNQPELYPNISADVCTDPDCYAEKESAHHAAVIVEANKKGIPVVEGDAGEALMPDYFDTDSEFVPIDHPLSDFQRNAPSTENEGDIGDYLKGKALPAVATYVKHANGTVTPLYKRDEVQTALEKAGVCETEAVHAERMRQLAENPAKEPTKDAWQIKREAEELARKGAKERAEKEAAFRIALYMKLRQHARSTGLTLDSLREYAKETMRTNELNKELDNLYDFDTASEDEINAYIDQASAYDIQLLLIDAMLSHTLNVGWWDMQHDDHGEEFNAVLNMARHEGIDAEQLREEMFPTPIDVSGLHHADLVEYLKPRLGRINEIKDKIIADHPDLISELELAAKSLGYSYGVGGFHLQELTPADEEQATTTGQEDAGLAEMALAADGPTDDVPAKPAAKKAKKKASAATQQGDAQ